MIIVYLIFHTGKSINNIIPRPIVTSIGFKKLTIAWKEYKGTNAYAIKCTDVSTLLSKVVYTTEAKYEFINLNESHLYEFQVAGSCTDRGHGFWSRKSFPALPNMELG